MKTNKSQMNLNKCLLIVFVLLCLYKNTCDAYDRTPHNFGEKRHHHQQKHQYINEHHYPYPQQRCSHRLENALEHARRRSLQVKTSRSLDAFPQSPYLLYHTLYGPTSAEDDDYYYAINNDDDDDRTEMTDFARHAPRTYDLGHIFGASGQRKPHKVTASASVEVENLRVKVPPNTNARWVAVDKCNFSTENATLETRLIFPDLTLSGKVVLQPARGKCNMILRLRQAGIEFRTVPLGLALDGDGSDGIKRTGSATVRTDSHFAEPGFISVFAHSCQGPTGGVKYRQNSKRRYSSARPVNPPELLLSQPYLFVGDKVFRKQPHSGAITADSIDDLHQTGYKSVDNMDWSRNLRHRFKRSNDQDRIKSSDEMNFNDDILQFSDDRFEELIQTDARNFADLLSNISGNNDEGIQLTSDDRDAVDSAFSRELEKLFSMGVRSLLTTYMQRALQPAIKETLMENMGYTLSYG